MSLDTLISRLIHKKTLERTNILDFKRLQTYLYVSFGLLISIVGAIFVFMYFWEAVISRIGDSDQSLIFWYLPILFLGAVGMIGGLILLTQGIKKLKRHH